jgi:hypothetical protein
VWRSLWQAVDDLDGPSGEVGRHASIEGACMTQTPNPPATLPTLDGATCRIHPNVRLEQTVMEVTGPDGSNRPLERYGEPFCLVCQADGNRPLEV